MPIRPQHRWLYPIDWHELSREIRFRRAGRRCERCKRPHGSVVCHLGDGRWWDEADQCWRNGQGRPLRLNLSPEQGRGRTRVVLACAHLNHDPTDNRSRNLAALCQRCHMLHDATEHRRQRWLTRFRRKACGDLFAEPYSRGVPDPTLA